MTIDVEMTCAFCGKFHCVAVEIEDYINWANYGALVQKAFPYLSATEREQLISGVCPECQKSIFGE